MIIPTKESRDAVIQELLDKDYTDNPNMPIRSQLEYYEDNPNSNPIPVESVDKVLGSNYVEPNKYLQSAYENQFRSFSNKKDFDAFGALI